MAFDRTPRLFGRKLDFSKVKSEEDLESVVRDALQYVLVADSDEEAADTLRGWYEGNRESEVYTSEVYKNTVNVFDDSDEVYEEWEQWCVVIYAHYIYSGSDDYVYTFRIYKL